jgi:diguanylate cyclase (GGDEF)-like protein/PAS domain S-box-containing protein
MKSRDEKKIIAIGLFAGALFWILDAVIDSIVFSKGSFIGQLITDVSLHELYFRFFVALSFILFGSIVYRLFIGRKQAEDKLERSSKFLNLIFDSIRDPFIILDKNFRIAKVNDAYSKMKNIPVIELQNSKCYEATREKLTVCDDCVVDRTFKTADPCTKEKRVFLPDFSEAWVEIFTYPLFDGKGSVSHVIEYVRDITERKLADEDKRRLIKQLEFLSTTDTLTGLPNRRMLVKRLESEIERAKRYKSDLSLILCDLDYFKEINDSFGHNVGDKVLMEIGLILGQHIRTSDIVGRYGGDEFMLILPETSVSGAQDMAERIRQAVEDMELILSGGKIARMTVSVGISHCRGSDVDLYQMINKIDDALYTSKRTGRNQVYSVV